MRFALRLLLPALVLLGPMQGRASAVTIQELLEFKGKLSDDVLVALIESDGSVFHLSISDVASLKEKGLSERVILAMLKTATKQRAETPVASPPPVYTPPPADPYGQPTQPYPQDQPQMISTDVSDQGQPQTKAPVVVNVRQEVTQHNDQPQQQPQYAQPYYAGYPLGYYNYGGFIGAPVVNRPVAQPVYWGWNGQRRPDSWAPTPTPHIPNQAISPMNQVVSPQNQAVSPQNLPSTTRNSTNNGRGGGGGE